MLVMLANNTGSDVGYLAGMYPGKVGHLYSPGAQRGPKWYLPYALDNERFTAGPDWSEAKWRKMLDWAKLSGQRPLWALVPDVVGSRSGTIEDWAKYAPILKTYGWTLAFAVQDGMRAEDVPADAEVVFVGGSTEWKWRTYQMWCREFPHVHIGRVNTYRRLWDCHDAGAKSCDGTGFVRGDQRQLRGLFAYMDESSGSKIRQTQGSLLLE